MLVLTCQKWEQGVRIKNQQLHMACSRFGTPICTLMAARVEPLCIVLLEIAVVEADKQLSPGADKRVESLCTKLTQDSKCGGWQTAQSRSRQEG